MIYEGTNEIQAIDLLLRKVLPDGGTGLLGLLDDLVADLGTAPGAQRARGALEQLAAFVRDELLPRTRQPQAPADLAHWLADDALRAVALALMAWAWTRIGNAEGADTTRWTVPHQAFWRWVWPEFDMRLATMRATLQNS
jgi:hypothetical protein